MVSFLVVGFFVCDRHLSYKLNSLKLDTPLCISMYSFKKKEMLEEILVYFSLLTQFILSQ